MPRKSQLVPPPNAAAVLATFVAWLIGAAAWMDAHHGMIGFFPPSLYPSRMSAEALAWSVGKKARHPDQLTTAWVARQRLAFERQIPLAPPPIIVTGDGPVLTLRFRAAVASHDRTAVYAPR